MNVINVLVTALMLTFASVASAQCKAPESSVIKSVLGEFEYGASNSLNIKDKEKEIGIALFYGVNYRLALKVADLPEGTSINVYNKSKEKSKRKLLFSSKDQELEVDGYVYFTFVNKSRKMYIQTDIVEGKEGCMSLIIGQKYVASNNNF